MSAEEIRRYTLHGRRKGKRLRTAKADLMQTLLPQVRIDLNAIAPKDPTWLEIGFGGGEHLADNAGAHPDISFIGCEAYVNGVASLLDHIADKNLQNIRIFDDDARILIDAMPDASIGRCFAMFLDPWPKKRYASRRFIGPDNLPKLARIMKIGAELRVATDDPVLQEWSLEHLRASKDFRPQNDSDNGIVGHSFAEKPDGWPNTRYEQKALLKGRNPQYYVFVRR